MLMKAGRLGAVSSVEIDALDTLLQPLYIGNLALEQGFDSQTKSWQAQVSAQS